MKTYCDDVFPTCNGYETKLNYYKCGKTKLFKIKATKPCLNKDFKTI